MAWLPRASQVEAFIVRMSIDSDNHPDNIGGVMTYRPSLGAPLFVIVSIVRWAARRHAGGGVADRTG